MNSPPRFGRARTFSIAAPSVAFGSGFASLLKPIWLSLIWTNARLRASAAATGSIRLNDLGTPPFNAQTTPAPPHAAHLSSVRRFNLPADPSSTLELIARSLLKDTVETADAGPLFSNSRSGIKLTRDRSIARIGAANRAPHRGEDPA